MSLATNERLTRVIRRITTGAHKKLLPWNSSGSFFLLLSLDALFTASQSPESEFEGTPHKENLAP
jgi:hypothetical protein